MTEREQTRHDIKKRLNSYREIEVERRQLVEELDRLELLMDTPGGSNWDGMPHGTGVMLQTRKDLAAARHASQRNGSTPIRGQR